MYIYIYIYGYNVYDTTSGLNPTMIGVTKMMYKYDKDHSGVLEFAEFKSIMEEEWGAMASGTPCPLCPQYFPVWANFCFIPLPRTD